MSTLKQFLARNRPARVSKLPIVELDRTIVAAPRKRITKPISNWGSNPSAVLTTTVGHALNSLALSEWRFYHAAAKTELAASFTASDVNEIAGGFQLATAKLLNWQSKNLRLTRGGVFSRKDATRSSYASQVGEAVLHLFMLDRKYVYWDHLPSLFERAMNNANIEHKEQVKYARAVAARLKRHGRPEKEPDYAFEKKDKSVALAEAKGSFVEPSTASKSMKGDLAYGLQQLAAWEDFISPRPSKSFVVGTYMREVGDTFGDPSMIAFVDPDATDPPKETAIEFPEDWIRRGNYGAWLCGMGFIDSGDALRNGTEYGGRSTPLLVVAIAGRKYACVLVDNPFPVEFRRAYDSKGHLHTAPVHQQYVVGLEVSRLRALEDAVRNSSASLVQLIGDEKVDEQELADGKYDEWFSGSIMPDRTLIGIIDFDKAVPIVDVDEFQL